MSLLPVVPGFIPPVVALPAANAIVPFIPSVLGGAALAAGMVGGAPPLAVIAGGLLVGAALGAALAQFWGWAGGRRGQVSNLPGDVTFEFPDSTESGVFSRGADGLGVRVVFDGYSGNWLTPDFGRGFVWWFQFSGNGLQKLMFLRGIRSNGSLGDLRTLPKTFVGNDQWVSAGTTWLFIKTLPSGDTEEVTKVPPFSPNPYGVPQLPDPEEDDDLLAKPSTVPSPLPLPVPSTDPQVVPSTEPATLPAPSPLVPVTPGPKAPPTVKPATPISPEQPKAPAPIAINNGNLVAPAPLPVPTTDPGAITPWPGANPIPGTGPAPAPTLQGIAQEVGRIERKLEVMMTPTAPGNLIGQIGNVADLIGQILSAVMAATSGTTYTLDSPCEVDEDGEKLPPVEVDAPGAPTQFGAILNRIDAVAELIQVHKDLKQPNCKRELTPVGEFVTVNFEQID